MKIRKGFVSNSSSSSFIIKLKDITALQQQQIIDHIEVAKQLTKDKDKDREMFYEAWDIIVKADTIEGFTIMDNFDMEWFLDAIEVNTYRHVEWDTNYFPDDWLDKGDSDED